MSGANAGAINQRLAIQNNAIATCSAKTKRAAIRTSACTRSNCCEPKRRPTMGGNAMVRASTITMENISKRLPKVQAAMAEPPKPATKRVAIKAAVPGMSWLSMAGALVLKIAAKAGHVGSLLGSKANQWCLKMREYITAEPAKQATMVA